MCIFLRHKHICCYVPLPKRDSSIQLIAGLKGMHVMPSVRAALRCQKAGIDAVVASGHERGFHASREPVHSIVLLPAVVDVSRGISGEAR
jgi:NAD(P)H-dependent flavin oxidoreductase YrpB (nitropropane dioxygenase family)